MKKLMLVLALAISLALAGTPASGAPNGTAISLIAGAGWRLSPEDGTPRVEFNVNAWEAPAGRVTGAYQYGNVAGLTLSGPITCGDVVGNVGVVAGTITDGTDFVGVTYLVYFVDNGPAQFGQISPDVLTQTFLQPEVDPVVPLPENFPMECPAADAADPGSLPGGLLNMLGEVVVHDGA